MGQSNPQPGDIFEASTGWNNKYNQDWQEKNRPLLILIAKGDPKSTVTLHAVFITSSQKKLSKMKPQYVFAQKTQENGLDTDSVIIPTKSYTMSDNELGRYRGRLSSALLEEVKQKALQFYVDNLSK